MGSLASSCSERTTTCSDFYQLSQLLRLFPLTSAPRKLSTPNIIMAMEVPTVDTTMEGTIPTPMEGTTVGTTHILMEGTIVGTTLIPMLDTIPMEEVTTKPTPCLVFLDAEQLNVTGNYQKNNLTT